MEKDEIEGEWAVNMNLRCQAVGICPCWQPAGSVCAGHWDLVYSRDRKGVGGTHL